MVAKQTIPVIGIKGKMYSGKSTAANYLVERYGYTRTRFAGPLKAMLSAFLRECGIDEETIRRMIEGDLKEVPSDYLGGKTPRHGMQTLGTEWGRELMSETLWVDAWKLNVDQMLARGMRVVVDDCRFPQERDIIFERCGVLFEMKNTTLRSTSTGGHASEAMDFEADFLIPHDGQQLATMHASIDCAMTQAIAMTTLPREMASAA